MQGFHVFAYGSLMWRPDFPYVSAVPATIVGRHRRLCVYSWHHRGSPQAPGLVLGLDRGGACRGILFRVRARDAPDVLAYLRAREQVTNVYREATVPARLADGRTQAAVAYVVDRAHPQYAGQLPRERILEIVARSHGVSGANVEYVTSTARHLAQMQIRDPVLAWLAERIEGGAEQHR